MYCVIKIEGEAHVLTYCPPENLVNDGTVKKRLIPIFATPTVNVDTVITLVQSVVAIHMWSSLQTDAVKYWHASSFITWSLLSLKMNNHFFLLHWVKCSSKGGSVLWVDISNTTIKVRTIPYDYDGIALTSIYIYTSNDRTPRFERYTTTYVSNI